MGYDVHITRRTGAEETAPQISEAESAAWTREHPDDGEMLYFSDGELTLKNPDESQLVRMAEIARALNATVRGDEGEAYSLGTDCRCIASDAPRANRQRTLGWRGLLAIFAAWCAIVWLGVWL